MSKAGNKTRNRILSAASTLVLERGFSGTSIDQILEAADVKKGAFFYHFKSKADLALALTNLYHAEEKQLAASIFERADAISRDPLQQVLVALGLAIEALEPLERQYSGCLLAAMVYSSGVMEGRIQESFEEVAILWRDEFSERLGAAVERHTTRIDVNIERVSNMFFAAFEGGFILNRVYGERTSVIEQVTNVRDFIELLFDVKEST